MCGIVGYIGKEQAAPILLDGLARLEYRGYDSAGVAVYSERAESLSVHKAKGRLQVLSDMLQGGVALDGTVGIGAIDRNACEPHEVSRYTLDGRRIGGYTPGVNIIRMSDGTTRKIVVE